MWHSNRLVKTKAGVDIGTFVLRALPWYLFIIIVKYDLFLKQKKNFFFNKGKECWVQTRMLN